MFIYFLTESKAHAKTGGSDSGLGTTIYSTTAYENDQVQDVQFDY